jgi:hypothetical protein
MIGLVLILTAAIAWLALWASVAARLRRGRAPGPLWALAAAAVLAAATGYACGYCRGASERVKLTHGR